MANSMKRTGGNDRKPRNLRWAAVGVAALALTSGVGMAVQAGVGARDTSADRMASSAEYPYSEADSARQCVEMGHNVGACIVAARTLRVDGAPLWREASVETRRACIGQMWRVSENVAHMYGCLVASAAGAKG